MKYNRALGANLMLGFTTANNVRFLDDVSRAAVIAALDTMSPMVSAQSATIDQFGATVVLSPGVIPLVPSASAALQAAAQAGNAVLIDQNFSSDADTTVRLVTNTAFLQALTNPAMGGTMAVLFQPQGMALPIPATLPPFPGTAVPAQQTPPAGAQVPPAKPVTAGLGPMALPILGGLGLLALVVVLSSKKGR